MNCKKEIIVGISGASGVQYGIRILEVLKELNIITHLIVTKAAEEVIIEETDLQLEYIKSLSTYSYFNNYLKAPISSGSYYYLKNIDMIIAPCSMNTLGKIANCISDNLIVRAADVCLKENKKLILMVRETPLNLIHLENMIKVKRTGGIIFPASPFFYGKPKSINELIDCLVGKALDLMNINTQLYNRWSDQK